MVFFPLIVVLIATHNFIPKGIGRYGDLSYGVYLFHFPTIQLIEHLDIYKLNAYIGFFLSLFITLVLAALSWHFVEKRFLKRSSHYLLVEKNK